MTPSGSPVGLAIAGAGGESGLKKGPWTASEDAILMDYVKKHGEGNWNAVQRNSGLNRCGKSCRLRWANHLRPNLKKGAFSPEEERLILELHAKYGNKWARMASQLPGRTDNEIKNYWNTRVKRRQRQGLPLYPYDIHPPSQSLPATPTSPIPGTPTSSSPATPTGGSFFQFHSPLHSFSSPSPEHSMISPFSLLPSHSSFTFHRPPPLLGAPVRFKPFRSNSAGFSHRLPAAAPPLRFQSAPQLSRNDSFQFPVALGPSSPEVQFGGGCMMKTEMGSNQYSGQGMINTNITLNDAINYGGGGLLEDMLDEAQACGNGINNGIKGGFVSSQGEEARFFDGFHKLHDSFSAGARGNEGGGERHGSSASEEWSKLLNSIPANMQVPQWYSSSSSKEEGASSPYGQTQVAEDHDIVGLDVQHIASLFPLPNEPDQTARTNNSCSWDNLPRIC